MSGFYWGDDAFVCVNLNVNGGEKIAPPGLNPEVAAQLTKRDGASIILYRLQATYKQKKAILDKIREINREGSAYNILGLLLKVTPQPNIMFCSQFVYIMLELAGLNYFEKDAAHIVPTDFIELDYYRNLDFVCRIGQDSTGTKVEEKTHRRRNAKTHKRRYATICG